MFRVLPLIAVLVVAACSKTPAQANTTTGEQAQTEAASPVPAELPAVLARVNGEDVTREEFQEYIQSLEARAGGPVPDDQRDQVYRSVLDQIVGYKLLQQEAKARNVNVPEAEINARIDEIREQFPSEDVFMQMLVSRNMTLDEVRADAREDMAIGKMIETEIAPKVAVDSAQVQDFYANNPDQFQQPERVRASHILIGFPENADVAARAAARTTAEQVLTEIKAGQDFGTLARQHSQDPGSAVNGGDLGFFQQGQMVGPFNDAAFSLKPGATSELVETQFGYHIIKVAEKEPARTIPLDDVRPQVEEFLANRNREEQTEEFVKALRARGKVEILI